MAGIEHQSDVKGEASFAQRLSRKIQRLEQGKCNVEYRHYQAPRFALEMAA
jgi:hypothetical protein